MKGNWGCCFHTSAFRLNTKCESDDSSHPAQPPVPLNCVCGADVTRGMKQLFQRCRSRSPRSVWSLIDINSPKKRECECATDRLRHLDTPPLCPVSNRTLMRTGGFCSSERDTVTKGCFGHCSVSLWVFSETSEPSVLFIFKNKGTPKSR